MSWKLGLIAPAVLSIAVFVVFAKRDGLAHGRPAASTKLEDLEEQVKVLSARQRESEVATTRNAFAVQGLLQAPATAPAPSAAAVLEKEQGGAPPAKTKEERRAELEFAFAQDRPDGTWTVADRRKTEEKIGAVLPAGSTLGSVECHSNICRVETTHEDRAAYDAFAREAFVQPKDAIFAGGGTIMRIDPSAGGGPIGMVSYASRGGPLATGF